jgi:selenocysteine-specific elongation factor
VIIGTAGHVDHGKTSLVRALTGIETDRLKEEKARGITIDLGFAYIASPQGDMIGFVDVPGHERFVRTMVAGSAGIDFALLVIAADDGLMPQTREHLDILDLLGLQRGLIVMTKCDRADAAELAHREAEIKNAVQSTFLRDADLLRVSTFTGDGIEPLRDRLFLEAACSQARDPSGRFRLSIDRVFSLKGVGTIATGTARAGRVVVGDEVTLLPSRQRARVRSLHVQNQAADSGQAGQRCALALTGAGVSVDSAARGSWICAEPEPHETARFDARLHILSGCKMRITPGLPVHFHCGASDIGARLNPLSDQAPGAAGLVQILLAAPLPLRYGDRFVLRDQSAQHTIGGGIVIDPRAPTRRRRSPERLARLEALAKADPDEALLSLLSLPPGFEAINAFAADRGLTLSEEAALQSRLGLVRLAAGSGDFVTTGARWTTWREETMQRLNAFHADHPELPGMPGERLRTSFETIVSKPLFVAMREKLVEEGQIAVQGHWVHVPGHVAQLSAEDRRLEALVRPLLAEDRFRPPRVRDMSAALAFHETNVRRACKALARSGALLELARDHFFLRETVVEMAQIAQDLTQTSPTHRFTAADFRDRLNNGRKVAIQILETFDRHGLTRREGDLRYVVKRPEAIFGQVHAGTGAAPR